MHSARLGKRHFCGAGPAPANSASAPAFGTRDASVCAVNEARPVIAHNLFHGNIRGALLIAPGIGDVSGTEAEVITWRIRARGPKGDVTPSRMRAGATSSGTALKGTRPVYFQEAGGFVETPVYDHYAVTPGQQVAGPAIVEQRESTVVVGPKGRFALDAQFNLIMHLD